MSMGSIEEFVEECCAILQSQVDDVVTHTLGRFEAIITRTVCEVCEPILATGDSSSASTGTGTGGAQGGATGRSKGGSKGKGVAREAVLCAKTSVDELSGSLSTLAKAQKKPEQLFTRSLDLLGELNNQLTPKTSDTGEQSAIAQYLERAMSHIKSMHEGVKAAGAVMAMLVSGLEALSKRLHELYSTTSVQAWAHATQFFVQLRRSLLEAREATNTTEKPGASGVEINSLSAALDALWQSSAASADALETASVKASLVSARLELTRLAKLVIALLEPPQVPLPNPLRLAATPVLDAMKSVLKNLKEEAKKALEDVATELKHAVGREVVEQLEESCGALVTPLVELAKSWVRKKTRLPLMCRFRTPLTLCRVCVAVEESRSQAPQRDVAGASLYSDECSSRVGRVARRRHGRRGLRGYVGNSAHAREGGRS